MVISIYPSPFIISPPIYSIITYGIQYFHFRKTTQPFQNNSISHQLFHQTNLTPIFPSFFSVVSHFPVQFLSIFSSSFFSSLIHHHPYPLSLQNLRMHQRRELLIFEVALQIKLVPSKLPQLFGVNHERQGKEECRQVFGLGLGVHYFLSYGECLINLSSRNSINSIKGRMGNSIIENAQKYLQPSNANLTIDNTNQEDPLTNYIKNRSSFDVKTLADVEKSSNQLTQSKKISLITPAKENTDKLTRTPSGRIENNRAGATAPNVRFSHDLGNHSPPRQPRRMTNIQQQFKTIAISQQNFIKVKKESPQVYYEMREKIGEGSYGQVFRAVDRRTQEERAIKVLKVRLMRQEKRKEFLAEMTLLSKLNHPSIITLYQLFSHNGKYYVVMQYCRGGTIIQILNRLRKQSETLIAHIIKQLLSALAYMHSLNIIHRDIKLDNIVFLTAEQERISIKIIDFGTAVQTQHKIIRNYPIAGTLSYLAPEVLAETLTEKSDVWSSAVLMYILLTGASPFKGKNEAETKRNILNKTIKYNEPPLKEVSEEAKDLLRRMLNRSINERITAIQALHHPWFAASKAPRPINANNLEQLSLYYRRNNFISLIESFLALRRITQEERQHLAEMFTSIDTDGNGVISREELIIIFRQQTGAHYSQEQVQAIIHSIDINDSGKIDFNEFIIAMYDRRKLYLKESLGQAFEYFDVDHTGFIEIDELREMLKGGDKAEVEYFFNVMDTDSDRKISREEFIEYLLAE